MQSLQWANITTSNTLKSAIEGADADVVYIQYDVLRNNQNDVSTFRLYSPSNLFYNTNRSSNSTPRVLIIKNKSKDEYRVKGGATVKLGGKDHGKVSLFLEGEVEDEKGNHARAKVSKEDGEDGYTLDVEAGKKSEKK